jgi:prepilin-type N-terminal cleavage/methylation domain-containing protein
VCYKCSMMRRKGFSLVELLVVMAIITLLAAFILPGLARAREYAYFTACKSNLRQVGIGFLLYAGNNKGKLPEGYRWCTGTAVHYRKFGGNNIWNWYQDIQGRHIVAQIYDEPLQYGVEWTLTTPNIRWTGRPRQPGRYLPVEIFWCPVVKLRNWDLRSMDQGALCGTEQGRDLNTRMTGSFGYGVFLHSVGCRQYQTTRWKNHVSPEYRAMYGLPGGNEDIWRSEEPFRWNTNSRAMTTAHKPSVWLAADWVTGKWSTKELVGHFGVCGTIEGEFRFNVVHLDGHVDDMFWKEPVGASLYRGWRVPEVDWGRPYGWLYYNGSTTGIGGSIKKEPYVDGAFDENK